MMVSPAAGSIRSSLSSVRLPDIVFFQELGEKNLCQVFGLIDSIAPVPVRREANPLLTP